MTTADTRITTADTAPGILAQFQTDITNLVNGLPTWYIGGTNNFLNNLPLGGYAISSTNFGLSAPLNAGPTVSTQPDASALTNANVLASQVEMVLRDATIALSNARQMQLIKYYYDAVFTPIQWYDSTVVTGILTDAYRIAVGFPAAGAPASDAPIDASSLDAYVTTLNTALMNHRTLTYNFNEYWCHAACHGSCHGSRNRR
jgi:hypothetical protein